MKNLGLIWPQASHVKIFFEVNYSFSIVPLWFLTFL